MNIEPFSDFGQAAQEVIAFLHQRLGFGLWMVTRTEGKDWIVLQAENHSYAVKPGDVFAWEDSFCSRMVDGLGPRIAPRSQDVPAYAAARIGQQVPIGAYIGVPLLREDGGLFGTLCAIDPQPQPSSLTTEQPLVELFARLLCTHLTVDLRASEAMRQAEREQELSRRDALTGLYNRRGWLELTSAEETRCRRLGYPACVLAIDLDGLKQTNDNEGHNAGDELIRRAAMAIRESVREHDIVARLGGDEFSILGVECNAHAAELLVARIQEALAAASVRASIGLALRDPRQNLAQALEEADRRMYAEKATRRSGGLVPVR